MAHPIRERSLAASLCRLVSHVVFMRSQEKMIRIDTGLIVAMVANEHAFWNIAAVQLIGNSVRQTRLADKSKLPVAVTIDSSLPFPALIRCTRCHIGPKCDFEGWLSGAMTIQETQRFALDPATATICLGRNARLLTTAAMTVAVRNI